MKVKIFTCGIKFKQTNQEEMPRVFGFYSNNKIYWRNDFISVSGNRHLSISVSGNRHLLYCLSHYLNLYFT